MAKDYELAEENRDIYEWIRDNGHRDFVDTSAECDAFVRGEQWDPKVKARLAKRRKPYLTVNKVLATCATLLGEHLVRRGDISFRATASGSPATARTIDKLWINFTQSQNYDWLEMAQFGDGIIRSRGFLDLRLDFDEAMRGEPALTYLNSKDVGLYPGDHGMDPDSWTGVLITKWLAPRDIAEIYNVPVKDVMQFADSPEFDSDYTDWQKDSFGSPLYDNQIISNDQRQKYRLLRVLERQEWEYKTANCFVDRSTGEVREIPEAWDLERIQLAIAQYGYGVVKRRVKKINWVVTAGDILLHNSISPYRHFTPIPYFPFLIGGKPVGIVEQLRDPQNLLNKTLSQELHIVAGIANSGYKVRRGALSNMTPAQLQERGGEDGIVIEVDGDLGSVEKLQPNQVPTGLDRLSYKATEAIQEISLVNDSMQGLNRADEAGRAIERKAIQGSTALSPIYASLDQTRRIVGRNWLDLIQGFVTEERVYYIAGRARTSDPEEIRVNQEQWDGAFLNDLTVGEYSVSVTNVQARDTYDQNQFDIMMQMIRQGAPIPWSEAVNALTILENRDEIVQFLKTQEGRTDPTQEQQEQAALQKRLMEAEASDKEASAQVKQAQAQKSMAQASKTAQGDNTAQINMMQAAQDAQLKEQDAILKERQATHQAMIKAREQEAKREEALQKALLDAEMAKQQLQFEKEKQQMELQKMHMELLFTQQKQQLELEKMQKQVAASFIQAESNLMAAERKSAITERQMETKIDMETKKSEINQT